MSSVPAARPPLPDSLTAVPVLAILRGLEPNAALAVGLALVRAGVRTLEVTLNSPHALHSIQLLRADLGDDCIVGAGTVLDQAAARSAIEAGAQLLVTPHVAVDVARAGTAHGVPSIIGAFTPSEVLAAWMSGASAVKVFPAARLGTKFVSDLRGPFGDIPLASVGGLGIEDVVGHLDAGAIAVGLGSSLVDRDPDVVRNNATRLMAELERRRSGRVDE